MVILWIQKMQLSLKWWMHLNYTVHKPDIYTIWYIKYDSICYTIGMRKYPQKCFQLSLIPGEHINWNKEQISIILGRRSNFPSTFEFGHFGIKW